MEGKVVDDSLLLSLVVVLVRAETTALVPLDEEILDTEAEVKELVDEAIEDLVSIPVLEKVVEVAEPNVDKELETELADEDDVVDTVFLDGDS